MTAELPPIFRSKSGARFRGAKAAQIGTALEELTQSVGVSYPQAIEAASYSMAMVVRYALGLSAEGGSVGALINGSIGSGVALATLRHLVNAGSSGKVLSLLPLDALSPIVQEQLRPLEAMGVEILQIDPSGTNLDPLLSSFHNILCGLGSIDPDHATFDKVIEVLNEASTPIHSVLLPPGIDPDSGKPRGESLFSSSTLSLGSPLEGLFFGHEYAGRHYVCDISFTKSIYSKLGDDLGILFSEQPVVQIFPELPEEDEKPEGGDS